jgi:lysophospholipase L1-like esterase
MAPTTTARVPRSLLVALLALAAWCAAATGTARAAATGPDACTVPAANQYLAANASVPGVISLIFFDAEGSPVEYAECIGGELQPIGTAVSAPNTMTTLTKTWSCKRAVREFVAAATLPSGRRAIGSFSVRTPSCARRFEISAPRRVKPGSTARIRITDRWAIGGIRPRLCITAPHAKPACRTVAFPRAVSVASRRFRASSRGRWRVELRVGEHRVRTAVAVGDGAAAAPTLPTLLATGDSTMQGIDNFLADDLGDTATVRSDVRPGTGISKLNPWARISATDVKRLRPSVTVISIGANDAWPMPTPAGATVTCCDEAWVAEYVARVRSMMQTYLRGGRGRVFWLTLPVPRDARRVEIFAAVNRAILRAADGVAGVTVLRMDQLFSPHGYQDAISWRGHAVHVREPDGIHLNVSGTAIAASVIKQALSAR